MSRPRSLATERVRGGGAAVLVRSALFNAWFLAFTFAMSSAGIPLRWMAPWRTAALARHWARGVLGGLRLLCGIDYVLLGREHLPAGGAMLVAAEHQSAFDTVVWHALVQSPVYVVKQELMRLPLFGPLLRHGGQIGIDTFTAQTQAGRPFGVVVTDLGMPYVDGRRVAAAIKALSPATPVILLTGWGQRLVSEGDVPPHVDRVLNKPPRLLDLRTALADVTATASPPKVAMGASRS